MLNGLNEPQREAASHVDGPLLIFASAGSGKTSTLTKRTARLVAECGVDPSRILLVTFTNKAANEMKERMVPLLGRDRTKRIWAGTFHSICARILRSCADEFGRRKDFAIYDDSDQETVLKQVVAEMRLDKKMYAATKLATWIQNVKQNAWAPHEVPAIDPNTETLLRVWERYDAWLRGCNAVDFEDLILFGMRLAESPKPIGEALRKRFDHTLVDEFQDTNFTQYRLVKALASNGNLCVVGDDDQCLPHSAQVLLDRCRGLYAPIENIHPGDRIVTAEGSVARVTHKTMTFPTEAIYIATQPGGNGPWICCTPNHPLFVDEESVREPSLRRTERIETGPFASESVGGSIAFRMVRAGYVQPGMRLFAPTRVEALPEVCEVRRQDPSGQPFYDLSVAGSEKSYIANDLAVHNCIYTWRGASVKHIREFAKEFPDAKTVKLEQNYRSTKAVVACAVGIIEKSQGRVPKRMWTANADGRKVEVVETPSDREEARLVVKRMRQFASSGTSGGSMAVLYRAHSQSRVIEDALRDAAMAYRIVGGHRFYDRKEVKDILAYLRLLSNPSSDVDLLRVINVPSRGIGAGTTKRLSEIAASRAIGLWDALPIAEVSDELGRKERMQLKGFRDLVTEFGKRVDVDRPSELALRVVDGTGYRKMWEDTARDLDKDGQHAEARAARDRAENAVEVVNALASYEKRQSDDGEIPTLRGFLENVTLDAEKSKDDETAVRLMTVHAAKGLEFDAVFLVGWERGRFPSTEDLLENSEDRRLAYVAVSRARKRLLITHAQTRYVYGVPTQCSPSPFLFDLPAEWIERMDLQELEAKDRRRLESRHDEF